MRSGRKVWVACHRFFGSSLIVTVPEYFEAPSSAKYRDALETVEPEIGETQFETLRAQYGAPGRATTTRELARLVGHDHFRPMNALYGRLGRLIAKELGQKPKKQSEKSKHWWSVLSTGESTARGFQWKMRPQVADALEKLGWVDAEEQSLPAEVPERETGSLREGAVQRVQVNAYERSSSARRKCIEHYGCECYICGFDFEKRYGEAGKGFIHVHHEKPLSVEGEETEVHPVKDLKPVCPNCHAIVHREDDPFSVEEVRKMLRQ